MLTEPFGIYGKDTVSPECAILAYLPGGGLCSALAMLLCSEQQCTFPTERARLGTDLALVPLCVHWPRTLFYFIF